MKKTIFDLLFLAGVCGAVLAGGYETASGQEAQKIELTAKTSTAKRDRNIGKPKPPSGAKGGAVCTITLINATPHAVQLYVNNRLAPLTAGLDQASQSRVETGRLKIYARTDRIGRNFLYWGPTSATCGTETKDGQIEMKIESDPVL
jgi:hypothetical protein